MTRGSPVRAAAAVALALVVGLCGCGDPMLWTRYRAERDAWSAGRAIERIRLNPQQAGRADYARAEAALARVLVSYPAGRYATPEALRDPYAADIARIAGSAAVAQVRLRQAQGRHAGAVETYARILEAYRGVRPVAREAMHGYGQALLHEGRHREAAAAWRELWEAFPIVPEGADDASPEVLAAPFEAAAALELAGTPGEAAAFLAAGARRMEEEAVRHPNTPVAARLWEHAAEAAARSGDRAGSIRALRAAIAEPTEDAARARMIMSLAERYLEAGDAESTLVYTAWAQAAFGAEVHAEAVLLGARAFDARGLPDSALARLNTFLGAMRLGSDGWVRGRYERALVLERRGFWEQARSEYRTIVAGAPSHVLGIDALVRIVRHHAEHGEDELARMEGRHAIETIDRLLGVARDDSIQVRARRARGELQFMLDDRRGAYDTWVELWRRFPGSAVAAAAGMDAAELAERGLGDREAARTLYGELAGRAPGAELRERAQEALKRLGGRPPGGTTAAG